MEAGGSSVPGDTESPAATTEPGAVLESGVAENANTDRSACEKMAFRAVGDDDCFLATPQMAGSELVSDVLHEDGYVDHLELADSNLEDNVVTSPCGYHAHDGVLGGECEEQGSVSVLEMADAAGLVNVGSGDDDAGHFTALSSFQTATEAKPQVFSGIKAAVCLESYLSNDDPESCKEFASSACGPCGSGIDDLAANRDNSQLKGQIQGMHDSEGDQINENLRNTAHSQSDEIPSGTADDSITPCHPEGVVEDFAEDNAHGSAVVDTFLVDTVESRPGGLVPGPDAIEANQTDGSSSYPSEQAVKPVGFEDVSMYSSGCALKEELIQLEKLDGLLPMHTGLEEMSGTCCLPERVDVDGSVQMGHKEESHSDSSAKAELCSAYQGSPLSTVENVETSGACSLPEKVDGSVHMADEEDHPNDSSVKVGPCNSCRESPVTEPICSHVEESSSSHLQPGSDAPDFCHFTEKVISGSIGSSHRDRCEDNGTCGADLHLFTDPSCFQEEPLATHLQHPMNPADPFLLLQGMAASTGQGSDGCAKSTPTSCGSVAECQPECSDLPENGGNDAPTTDPVSIRRNPRRAAHFKCLSTRAKPPIQTSIAAKASKPVKIKNKKSPVSRGLIHVSFENITRKITSRNVVRRSGWGTTESLYKMFENRSFSDLSSDLNCTTSTSIMMRKCSRRKRSNFKKSGKGSSVKCVLDEDSLTADNQRNTQAMFPGFADSLYCESLETNYTAHVKKSPEIERTSIPYACSQVQPSSCYMNPDNQATCSTGDAPIGDKDLESSVTLETSNENYPSDYPVVSSQTGPRSLAEFGGDMRQTYADTSPESEVIHPASDVDPTTNDIATYINQKACGVSGVRSQNDCFPGSHLQDNLDFATYGAPSPVIPSSSLCSEPHNPVEGKENGEILGPSSETIQEKNVNGFGWERNARSEHDKQTDASSSKCYKRKTKKKPPKEDQCQELQANCQSLKIVENRCYKETQKAEIGRQYRSLPFDHNEKSMGAICTEGKMSKCRTKLKDSARSKQHDSFRRNKKNSISLCKKKKSKEKSLCVLAPGDGHHEVDAQREDIHNNPSEACASFLSETAQSKRSMSVNNLHKSQCVKNADSLLDSGNISRENTTWINAEQGLQSFGPLEDRQCWVRCDDCFKWRFIPTTIADALGEDCKWTCKDNIDKNFADCIVPQVKTDAEINAELGISDEEEYNTAKPQFVLSTNAKATKPQAPWTLIRSNLFLHRNRKKQNIDEVMVCQCRPPKDGRLGCGDACLNRMLNIECVRGTCPCGDLCSNQQFQRRKYAKLKWFRCGKKGYGLQVQQNIPRGKFLIEYVGEVLDMVAYETRQREYASRGQRHFYFMTLNGSEVIDACYKGNLGRFINHSCNPNCRTEKWMVNGEVCIGLFAIRDIKKGEEVTFDYNYVRVFGAAAKKCFCGASDCRGYIGGDPLNAEHIVQCDSDEEFPEPVMVKDGEVRSVMAVKRQDVINMEYARLAGHEKDADSTCLEFGPVTSLRGGDECLQSAQTVEKLSPLPSTEVTCGPTSDEEAPSTVLVAPTPLEGVHPGTGTIDNSLSLNEGTDAPLETAETISGSTSETSEIYKTLVNESTKHPIPTMNNEELTKSVVAVKSCVPSVLAKNNRSEASRHSMKKGKKMVIGGRGCHFEGVDDKLKAILNADGGISKHTDAAMGYLKLLVLTAASRDNAESEAIQSTRDMSLILDSLLKTKSRTVLTDIINKNGLQMLHNILKQSRRNNNKVPILRKLLKVFEFFALKKILTVEHINMTPSHEGVESFRSSILILTHHADAQVSQIARNFLKRWIPRSTRNDNQSERNNWQLDMKNMSSCHTLCPSKRRYGQLADDANKISPTSCSTIHDGAAKSDILPTNQKSCTHDTLANENLDGLKRRRRRTRWDRDEPAFVEIIDPQSSEHHRDYDVADDSLNARLGSCFDSGNVNFMHGSTREEKHSGVTVSDLDNSSTHDVDELPPGFDSPSLILRASKNSVCSVDLPDAHDVVAGIVQERYLPHLAISHGIPIQLMQKLGTPANEGSNRFSNWTVAPGMPFHPFPPLPSYPRKKSRPNHPPVESSGLSESHCDVIVSGPAEVLPSARSTSSSSEPSVPSTSGRMHHQSRSFISSNPQPVKRGSPPMTNAVRDSFRHQRCRDHRSNDYKPAWPRERNRHQFTGTKRCRTQNIADCDVLGKGGGSSASEG